MELEFSDKPGTELYSTCWLLVGNKGMYHQGFYGDNTTVSPTTNP